MGCNMRLVIQVAKNGVMITTEDDIGVETQLCLSHRQAMFYISKELWRITTSVWKKPVTEKSIPEVVDTEDSDPY